MILLIYPLDPTIRRIKRLGRRLAQNLPCITKKIELQPNDASKTRALHSIKESGVEGLIVFMGHGRSDALFGARGKNYNYAEYADTRVMEEFPEDFYNDDSFIDETTYRLFAGRKVVIFACVSSELGVRLVNAGARTVLGFGKLPTTVAEFNDDWHYENVNTHVASAMSGILDVSFCRALMRVVRYDGNFADLAYSIKDEIHWHIAMLLYSKAKYRFMLADVLSSVEKSIVVLGDSSVQLLG